VRLLVVDDEVRLAAALARGLTSDGFVVDVANDGDSALRLAAENEYDALVLDILLPRLSGYEVLRRLRARDDWTPVLMLSAKDGEYDQADALDLGADDYIVKPYSYVLLLARLRALLRRGRRPRPAVLECGPLTIDPAAHEVRLHQVPVELTPREFALLEYLATHAGEVVAKSTLLEHVWDAGGVGDPNLVEVYVRYLRQKLGAELIQTVRGVGYRLAA
jgi:DNA-binding response OmpR family regulator